MTKTKTLRDYLAPEFKELSLTCEAGFAISNEGLTDENWDWDAPQA
jgi:hypothetical protein